MSKGVEIIGGVQVSVETGTATVVGVDPRDRNVEVRLQDPALAGKLRFPLKGWLDKADTDALAVAERVNGTQVVVRYRIESHRDAKVDPTLPIAEVPQTSRFRRLVALTENVANVAAEPMPWDDLPPACNNSPRPGPRVMEAMPWEASNSDGSPNLGSYEVLAAVGMTELAHELMLARAAEAGQEVFGLETMRRLARTFLAAADRVQAAVRTDGHADRMDNSHARARGAVRAALEAHPVPWDGTADEKAVWVEDLVAWGTEILRCALELATVPPVRDISRNTSHNGDMSRSQAATPASGGMATNDERQAAISAARRADDTDASRDAKGETDRNRLEQFMRANGIPPLIAESLTSEQALRVRAYLANIEGAQGAAA